MTGKYLITTDAWFLAPDGKQYKSAWGEVEILSDSILGIKTNLKSTNWFAKVGSLEKHIIIAGCQIHYACKSKTKPNDGLASDYQIEAGELKIYDRPSQIYCAE
jgi:hypothetical protein